MKCCIDRNLIETGSVRIILEENAYSGLFKIADLVAGDFEKVFGARPAVETIAAGGSITCETPIICATDGNSKLLDELEKSGIIDLSCLDGKQESYMFAIVPELTVDKKTGIIIAGTDKRGTIYGMFHLSELLGVSPFVNWLSVNPPKKDSFEITTDDNLVSKTPSVRFRGFFINDEWPAFGNWCNRHFGGFTKECYTHIFELLLRLKGNYLWPAMWTSRFSVDGPGLDNAILADELGVVMGMSHHEPCLRHGEEYKYLRGKDSIYGDAWNFITNREGITKFWGDGLKRSGGFENVITVGMRGEADSTIMGKDSTLKDNIDLLRDVLKTQNKLIKEYVSDDLKKVPRMLALYKEVEPFFYGDDKTKGLMDDPELEDVILMLCDDNFGNMRTLPTEHMREHNGGYGMYYHFDYHGWPISFEWVNSTALTKVWEQMTQCYEFGVNSLWIVNVGDVFTMEYPLSYFLDLAYDYDKWGITNPDSASEYTKQFVDKHFASSLGKKDVELCEELINSYTGILSNRRPEAMNVDVYSPCNFNESEELLAECNELIAKADDLLERCPDDCRQLFYELIHYPLTGGLNVCRIWLATGINHYLTDIKAAEASRYADMVREWLKLDQEIVDRVNSSNDEKWYGMGMSEHIGFNHWNEEECSYPVLYEMNPPAKKRIVVTIPGTAQHTEGGDWTGKELILGDFLRPDCTEATVRLYNTAITDTSYSIDLASSVLSVDRIAGQVPGAGHVDIIVHLNRAAISEKIVEVMFINGPTGRSKINIPICDQPAAAADEKTYIWCGANQYKVNEFENSQYEYISIDADGYAKQGAAGDFEFKKLENYGHFNCGMKVMPVVHDFSGQKNGPYLEYVFEAPEAGEYEVKVYTSPANPTYMDNNLFYGVAANGGQMQEINMIPEGYKVSDDNDDWKKGVLDNVHSSSAYIECMKGINSIRITAISPGFVLEKIVICKKGYSLPESYKGPKATFSIK